MSIPWLQRSNDFQKGKRVYNFLLLDLYNIIGLAVYIFRVVIFIVVFVWLHMIIIAITQQLQENMKDTHVKKHVFYSIEVKLTESI